MRVFPDDDDDDVYYSEGRRPREDELPCNWHVIDECWGVPCLQVKEHTGSAKDDHETVLTALEQMSHDTSLTTFPRNVPAVEQRNLRNARQA